MASHGLFLNFPRSNGPSCVPYHPAHFKLPLWPPGSRHETTRKIKKGGGDGTRKLPLEIGSGSRTTRISGPSLKLSGCRRVDERERFQWRPESAEPGIDGPEPCDRSLHALARWGGKKGSSGRRGDKDSESPDLSRQCRQSTRTH